MNNSDRKNTSLKYLTPENLYTQLNHFTEGLAVTRDAFELRVPMCTMEDIEWNHMDQMHRPSVHNTYEKGVRIACGTDFAVSLTQWKKWPFFITVTDVYVAKGLFYQSLTIAGILFVHSIISMEQDGNDIKLKDEWYIASSRWFKFLHKPLSKKLHKLNERLQQEDEPLRQGRFLLRKQGYEFKTNQPNYYNSNVLGQHTVYPPIAANAVLSLQHVTNEPVTMMAGNIEFIVKKDGSQVLIWPSTCPHEGGPLIKGHFCDKQVTCPWHGLKFSAIILSEEQNTASRYGFAYVLRGDQVYVTQVETIKSHCPELFEEELTRAI